jgi:hypothetical protein
VGVGARSIARLFPDLSILEKCLKRARLSQQAKRPSRSAKYRLDSYGPHACNSQARLVGQARDLISLRWRLQRSITTGGETRHLQCDSRRNGRLSRRRGCKLSDRQVSDPFPFNFLPVFGSSHASARNHASAPRNDGTTNHIHNIRQRPLFDGTRETCDEVTHAAEPVKFDNLRKSAQR